MSAGRELVVRYRRTSPTHHRFEVERAGVVEGRELETRSTLLHDLAHFALELEAGLTCGFFGALARGIPYEQLATPDAAAAMSPELAAVERVVAALQGSFRSGIDADAFVAGMREYHRALGEPTPAWLTVEMVARAAQRLRALDGAWRGTQFGQWLELRFPHA